MSDFENNIELQNLEEGEQYDGYLVAEDDEGNEQAVPLQTEFETLSVNWTLGYPKLTFIGPKEVKAYLSADVTGSFYGVVQAADLDPITNASALKDKANVSGSISADTETLFYGNTAYHTAEGSAESMTKDTAYKIYVMVETEAEDATSLIEVLEFTTVPNFRTQAKKQQVRKENIQKRHINTDISGEAIITNIVNSDGIIMAHTGADAGTGEVTLSVNTGAGVTIDEGQVAIAEAGITSGMLDPDVAGAGINHDPVDGLYLTGGDGIEIVEGVEDDTITVKLSDGLTIDEGDITVKVNEDGTIIKDVNGIKVGAGSLDDSHIADGASIETSKLAEGEFFIKSDGTVAMAADLNLGDNKITNLEDPIADSDAANKYYVDITAQGLTTKKAVMVATTDDLDADYTDGPDETNPGVGATLISVAVTDTLTVDEITLEEGDRVLVKDQVDKTQNGIYVLSTPTEEKWVLTRADDFDNHPTGEVYAGVFTFVGWGDVNKGFGFVMTKPLTHDSRDVIIGTSELSFTQFSGAGQLDAGDGIKIEGQTISAISSEGVTIDEEGNVTLLLADTSLVQDANGVSVNLGRGLTLDEVDGVSISEDFQTVDKFILNEYHVISAVGYIVNLNEVPREDTPVTVFLNGVMQNGEGSDYSIDGNIITFTDSLYEDDLVSVIYIKQ